MVLYHAMAERINNTARLINLASCLNYLIISNLNSKISSVKYVKRQVPNRVTWPGIIIFTTNTATIVSHSNSKSKVLISNRTFSRHLQNVTAMTESFRFHNIIPMETSRQQTS